MNDCLGPTLKALMNEAPSTPPFILLKNPTDHPPTPLESLCFNAPFAEFEAVKKQSRVLFTGFTNHIDMVDLRKLCHRAAHILDRGGLFQYIARNPDDVLDQNESNKPWPGEAVKIGDESEIYRPLRQHFELLRLFGFRLKVPSFLPGVLGQPGLLLFTAVKEEVAVAHLEAPKSTELTERCDEKYGPDSPYRRFNRLEEPEIVDDLLYGMRSMGLKDGDTVLGLGSNDGRELQLFHRIGLKNLKFIGIDASEAATAEARRGFNDPKHQFMAADLGALSQLKLKPVQGILLLNVLQCTTVNRDKLLNDLKALFAKRCAVLVSLPNNHFLSGDLARRPLSRKDPRHDRSLLLKDLRYLTRYFYRTPFKSIECFGSYDSFLLAQR